MPHTTDSTVERKKRGEELVSTSFRAADTAQKRRGPIQLAIVLLVVLFALLYHSILHFRRSSGSAVTVDDDVQLDLPFVVVEVPGKGKGAVATRDIQVRFSLFFDGIPQ